MKSLQESLLDNEDILMDNSDRYIIEQFLKDNYNIDGKCVFNKNNVIDVYGNVYFKNKKLEYLTNGIFTFGEVTGDFYCDQLSTYECKLKTLKGAPKKVGRSFNCATCLHLTTLEGAPKECKNFFCTHCQKLISLEGAPEIINNCFDCSDCNKLKTLKGAPKKVSCFDCSDCFNLTSLEGAPEKVGGDFFCNYCLSLTSIKGAPKKIGKRFVGRGNNFTEDMIKSVCDAREIWI